MQITPLFCLQGFFAAIATSTLAQHRPNRSVSQEHEKVDDSLGG